MNPFAPLTPLLVFVLLWGIFYKIQGEWRGAFLSAAVGWGVALTAITEILSLFGSVSFWPVLGAWGVCLTAAILAWIKFVGSPGDFIKGFKRPDLSRLELLLLGSLAFIAVLIALIAWVAPPNTWDTMTYHLSRVMHWIQDGNVAFYPTHMISQLFLGPGAEFIFLHFQILSGGDHLATFAQWFAMLGSAIGISLIARELGANGRGQIFGALISMTIPMGVLQASSTHNDFIVTFWLVTCVYFLLWMRSNPNYWLAIGMGASLGLASLTKATTYILILPFLVWIGIWFLRTGFFRNLRVMGVIAVVFIALNLGYYVRNGELFGSPLGTFEDVFSTGGQVQVFKYSNDIYNISSLISNTVRNISVNLGTPFDNINNLSEQGVNWIHTVIGLSPNDPRTTWPGVKFQVIGISFSEDSAGNPLQILLIIATIFWVVFKTPRNREREIYSLSLISGFLLFSFYLKWQPWNSRLELPFFVLWAAIAGTEIGELRSNRIANGIVILLLLGALPWVFFNQARPLLGSQNIFNTSRNEQYFRNDHSLWYSYPRVALALSNDQCKKIGLYFGGGNWEYPLWVFLQEDIGNDFQIESVNVDNVSAREYKQVPEFTPCAVLVASSFPINNFEVGNTAYTLSFVTKYISVLTPK